MLAMQELGCFQLPGIVYRSLQHGAVHYHAATWGDSHGWMAQQWPSGSRHGISVHSKYTAHPHNAMHGVCHLPCIVKTVDLSVKRTPLQSARRHRMWAFAHSSRLQRRTAVRSRPRWGRRACRWGSLRRFLTVCTELLWLCNRLFQQLSGWLVSDDLRAEDAGCGGPGRVWLHVVCGCEAGWMYCQILWNAFGDGLW